jgi:hypothetical protein
MTTATGACATAAGNGDCAATEGRGGFDLQPKHNVISTKSRNVRIGPSILTANPTAVC